MHSSRSTKWLFYISLIACLAFLPGAVTKNHGDSGKSGPKKFKGLDRNNDGRIQRDEWRGSDRSFTVHDRNRDGVISGTEIDPALQAEGYDDFSGIDRNRDGRISGNEWRWDRAEFDRIDDNRDGVLTHAEYVDTIGEASDSHFTAVDRSGTEALTGSAASSSENRYVRFGELDRNGNDAISLDEWDSDRKSFDALDDNNNGALSRNEFLKLSGEARRSLFKGFDLNGNGAISRSEWTGDKLSFNRLDTNNDGKVGREEFVNRYNILEQHFSSMDKNRDGSLSSKEWRHEKKLFDRLDENHDDQLSFVEFAGVR